MQGRDKIPLLLAEKGQDLLKQLAPYIIQMAIQAGIENIGTPNVKFPTTCLVPDELSKMLALRNNLVSQLNAGVKVITTLKKVLDPLNLSVTTGVKSLNTVNAAITAAQILASLSPVPPPGSPDPANSVLVGIDKSNKFLTNTIVPNLQKAKNIVVVIDDTPSNVINIQERIRQKAGECIGELEGQIDEMILGDFQVIPEPYGVMHTMGIKSPHASKINAYFEKEKKRYTEILNTTDKLLKEGYSNFSKTEIKKIVAYCDRVITAGKKIQGDSRKTRKPRRKKVD